MMCFNCGWKWSFGQVGEKMGKFIEETKNDWNKRKTIDVNNIPDPNGDSKSKK